MCLCCFFFLMLRLPPRSTRTDTLFPSTTLFRSHLVFTYHALAGDLAAFGQQCIEVGVPQAGQERLGLAEDPTQQRYPMEWMLLGEAADRKSTRLNSSH